MASESSSRRGSLDSKKREDGPSARESNRLLSWVALGGLLGLLLYASQFSFGTGAAVFGVALGVAVASLLTGSLIGFLFAIPRVQPGEVAADVETSEAKKEDGQLTYTPNSNLIQISDWLTKILVGVGLIQLGNLDDAAAALGTALAPGLGGKPSSGAFGVTIAIAYLVLGFLVGYIQTRTVLSAAFREADVRGLTAFITTRITKRFTDAAERDAAALTLVNQQIELAPGEAAIPEQDLIDAVKEASPTVKVQIFARARDERKRLSRSDPTKLPRLAPVFRALIAADPDGRYHRNHAQLGYILKDQPSPDYAQAIQELSKAISIRDGQGESGRYRLYEFNRADCLIASGDGTQEEVVQDLKAAAGSPYLRTAITKSERITNWLKDKGLDVSSLSD